MAKPTPAPQYTVLRLLPDGTWSHHLGVTNTWPTVIDADSFIAQLHQEGLPGPWAIVQTHTLPFRICTESLDQDATG